MSRCNRGFTLVEMLVVVAIIVILISMLQPSLGLDRPRTALCLTQMHAITIGWQAYALDNARVLVDPFPGVNGWIGNGNSAAANEQGLLPRYYGGGTSLVRCPSEITNHYRTYSMSDHLGGSWPSSFPRRYLPRDQASRTFVLLEENDWRGYNAGSWVTYTTEGLWVDYVTAYHDKRSAMNISFADGHAETWVWQDPRTKSISDFYAVTPNNVDLQRLQSVFVTNR